MDPPPRDIDVATVSMSVVELNNMVAKLRKPMKYAQSAVIKERSRTVFRLKNKKATEKQLQENQRKAGRIQEQIDILKKCSVDKLIKFCLGFKSSFADVVSKGTAEEKVLARVANQKLINKTVSEWREKHPDWELLSAYLNTRITRRHKNRKMVMTKTQLILKEIDKATVTESKQKADESRQELEELLSNVHSEGKMSTNKYGKADDHSRMTNKLKPDSHEDSGDSDSKEEDNDSEDEDNDSEEEDSDSKDEDNDAEGNKDPEIDLEMDTSETESKAEKAEECPSKKKLDNFFLDGAFEEDDDSEMPSTLHTKGIQKIPFRTGSRPAPFTRNKKDAQKGKQDFHKNNNSPKNQNKRKYEPPVKKFSTSVKNISDTGNKKNKSNEKVNIAKNSSKTKQEALHPSWAAKRKEKEHNFINFQSKRIEFDDD